MRDLEKAFPLAEKLLRLRIETNEGEMNEFVLTAYDIMFKLLLSKERYQDAIKNVLKQI